MHMLGGEAERDELGGYRGTGGGVAIEWATRQAYAVAVAVDSGGNAYVTGDTESTNFPTQSPLQTANAGRSNAFVTKLNPAGSALVYSTYLGGSANFDRGTCIALDDVGNAYVTGSTASTDFPTVNPLQAANAGSRDAFVAKLNAAGSALVYSTYLGGPGADHGHGIAVDDAGSCYLTGVAAAGFPTVNPLTTPPPPGDPPPPHSNWKNAFITKLNPAGSALVYSTYLGGSDQDHGFGIALSSSGEAYVTGSAGSSDFPTVSPLQPICSGDAFVSKLNPAGSALVYSTCLGGIYSSGGRGIALDAAGDAYFAGSTDSPDFPTQGGIRSTGAHDYDAFVAVIRECRPLPGTVSQLKAVKSLPSDVLLSWDAAPDAATGYHVYAVDAKALVPAANYSSLPDCTSPASQLGCTHAGALAAPPTELYYQVVGVCADGVSEGPL
jgi:hypothetical protein